MAKKALRNYTFTPGAANVGTVAVDGYWPLESFLLITNTTNQTIIYNFADTTLGGTVGYTTATNRTTLTLEASTSTQSSTDKLQIFVDDWRGSDMIPSETYQDPVSKLRVSTPQSLIDTDFEYSTQPSKWESLALTQNYPSYYSKGTGTAALEVVSLSGNGASPRSTITVGVSTAHPFVTNDVVSVQDSTNQLADGTFQVTVLNTTTFTYIAKGVVSGSILDSTYTTITGGGLYPGSTIQFTSITFVGTVITVNTSVPHGLYPGTPIALNGTTATTNPPNGNWIISTVATPTSFSFIVPTAPTGTISSGSATLIARPESYQLHRSTDGGVSITTGGNYTGAQQIRQTRRYFRYQSGKAMQFSSGIKFTPTFDVTSLTAVSTTATVVTAQDHNLQVGATILVEGVEVATGTNTYNGTRTVASVTGTKSFTYTMSSTPSDLAPGGDQVFVTATKWTSASVRSGLFDEQNGFFFEYDGNQLFICRRQAIQELFGTVTVTIGSGIVSGNGTVFRKQLIVGDKIVIKGQTYEIAQIASDTSLRINPAYLGSINASNSKYVKVKTIKIPQSEWNLDRMDGTGPSGYNIDISKMQMGYIDYTWYGAGFIRFGFRAINGDIIYCHKIPNNNVNTAAYMRSGNLPGRFEAINQGYYSKLVAGAVATRGTAFGSADTTLYVEDARYWPTSGSLMVQDSTNSELINYTGIGAYNSTVRGYPITGLTRRTNYTIAGISTTGSFSATAYTLAGTTSSVTFTPDAGSGGAGTAQVSVQCLKNTCAPIVSHWGVSVIMDGRYDDDKSIIFTAGMNRYLSVGAGAQRPLLAIRIAPSVDSGIGRNFGVREITNRMQLTLNALGIYSQGQFLIEGILNPQTITGGALTFPTSWQTVSVGSGSLAQVVYFDGTQTYSTSAASSTGAFTGGDRIFAAYTENSGGTNFSTTRIELEKVRDLGTSILSGNGQAGAVNPGYPVGPDILLISARNLAAAGSSNIACRLSWTEAQA